MAKVKSPHGFIFLVDKEDLEKIQEYRINDHFYIRLDKSEKGKSVSRLLHHVILGLQKMKKGRVVDHVNGNTLDNRKNNLRICSKGENNMNQRAQRGRKYKGVTMMRDPSGRVRFRAQVIAEGKKWCQYFHEERAAVRAYNRKAREMQGEFARLNVWRGPSVRLKPSDTRPRVQGYLSHRSGCACIICAGHRKRVRAGKR